MSVTDLNHPTPEQWAAMWRDASEAQRALLAIVSAAVSPAPRRVIMELARLAELPGSAALCEAVTLAPLVHGAVADGLMLASSRGTECAPTVVELAARSAAGEGWWPALRRAISESEIAWIEESGRWNQRTPSLEQAMRELRAAFYCRNRGDIAVWSAHATHAHHAQAARNGPSASPWARILAAPLDPAWMASLPDAIVVRGLTRLLLDAAVTGEGLEPALAVALARLSTGDPAELSVLRRVAAELCLHLGRLLAVDDLLTADPTDDGLRGALSLARGDVEAALEDFERCEAARRAALEKPKRGPLPFHTDLDSWYLLALAARGEPADIKRLRAYVARARKEARVSRNGHHELDCFRIYADLTSGDRLDRTGLRAILARHLLPMELVSVCTLLAWVDPDQLAGEAEFLEDCRATAYDGGFHWVVAELDALAALVPGVEPRSVEVFTGALRGQGWRPLMDLRRSAEPWELALKTLESLAGKQVPAEERKERLVWQLTKPYRSVWVEPRLQKRGKKGWTAGRAVALKRLTGEASSVTALTEHDRRVTSSSLRSEVRGWGRHHETVITVDHEAALVALAGHPNVYWDFDLDTPVTVTVTSPRLQLARVGSRVVAELHPSSPPAGTRDIPNGAPTIQLIEWTKQHDRLAATLGPKGLAVPDTASDRLVAAVAAVAGEVELHTDLDLGGAAAAVPEVEGDARVRVSLRPGSGGLRVSAACTPLGPAGPMVSPGLGSATMIALVDGRRQQATRDLERERLAAAAIIDVFPDIAAAVLDGDEVLLAEPAAALELVLALQKGATSWSSGRRGRRCGSTGGRPRRTCTSGSRRRASGSWPPAASRSTRAAWWPWRSSCGRPSGPAGGSSNSTTASSWPSRTP